MGKKKITLCVKHHIKRMKQDPNFGEKVIVDRIVVDGGKCEDCKKI
jgi:hypothetical protein